ncbi:adenylate cyclase [Marinobacterium zhoushanense]|uniref:Adenylate cyclase n=1 Tax=Marinobacterium zhoushanense TaxID=1679163 RepID=A0ABQ1KF68_9GAMM|nr:adenylate/guanylate cyclase domain-containing protein [Marinobacterium zhoushanense]GGB97799.1 adenylate cyclase [Marinobacterium zhoushanense]
MVNSSVVTDRYDQLLDWLHRGALGDWDVPTLMSELIGHLQAFGMGLHRVHFGLPMLHPLYVVSAYTWQAGEGVVIDNYPRGITEHSFWLKSPVRPFYESGAIEGRIKILPGSESDHYPMLKTAGDNGATDYYIQLTNFNDRSVSPDGQEGIVVSWMSSKADGFSDDDLALLRKLHLPLCAQLKNLTHRRLVDDILQAYLGDYSGKRVHAGQIQRGDGELIDAVIYFCDLRQSSKLAELYDPAGFLDVLNQYFELTAGTIADFGGEVLRFIGDASLAIFPIERFGDRASACRAALAAALETVQRSEKLNSRRSESGEPAIEFGIGLHPGSVLYGNIGTPTRLEFTVIGSAANEAARIESQCRELDQPILVSREFADNLDVEWQSQGQFSLRNIGRPIEILSPPHQPILH